MRKKTRNQLFIRIAHDPNAPWHWCFQPEKGETKTGVLCPNASQHHLPETEAELTLLLPAGRILFRDITFPRRWRRPAPQVLLWQVEDFTLEEIEHLHASVIRQNGNHWSLAVINRALLKQWLATLERWSLRPSRAFADVLTLPPRSAVKLGNEWLVRCAENGGVTAADNDDLLLQRMHDITCLGTPPAVCNSWIQGENQAPMTLLIQGCKKLRGNLLTGDFIPTPTATRSLPRRCVLALATCLLLSWIVVPFWLGLQARNHTVALLQQIQDFYQHHTGEPGPVSHPRKQLAKMLMAAEATHNQPTLLRLLSQSQPLLNALPADELKTLNWDGEQIQLILTRSEASLNNLLRQHELPAVRFTAISNDANTTTLIITGEQP
ncbi:type II secretion system protein GspL [Enterobacter cloacae]|uniref:type II secretion system protein GspL n=1 Tax=Enterobacter cloacae TaxID=550 RepID=UPI00101B19B7|nr:type II secretion system protein GspL [Enterobacter cloacae]QBC03378.1 hypothetical protein EWI30_15360 [Enterobacter cloacae]